MKRIFFLAAAASLALAACSNHEDFNPGSDSAELQVVAEFGSAATRAATNGSWATDALIGITATGGSTGYTAYNNAKWKLQSGASTAYASFAPNGVSGYTFAEGSTVNFAAVAYNSSTQLPTVANNKVSVAVTSGNAPENLYIAKNVSATSAAPTVKFTFQHAMAKLTINTLTKAEGIGDIKSATLSNYYTSADVSITDGATSNFGAQNATVDLTTPASAANDFIIIPAATEQTLTLTVVANGNTYHAYLKKTFEANKHYTFTVNLTLTGLELVGGTGTESDGCKIEEWDAEGTTNNVDASMNK